MKCNHCGNPLKGTEKFCDSCGNKIEIVESNLEVAVVENPTPIANEEITVVMEPQKVETKIENEETEVMNEFPEFSKIENETSVLEVTDEQKKNIIKTDENNTLVEKEEVVMPSISPEIEKEIEKAHIEEEQKAREKEIQKKEEEQAIMNETNKNIEEAKAQNGANVAMPVLNNEIPTVQPIPTPETPVVMPMPNNAVPPQVQPAQPVQMVQPMEQPQKKSHAGLIIGMIILFIAMGVAGAVGGYFLANSDSNTKPEENNKKEDNDDKDDDNEVLNPTPTTNSTISVKFLGETLSLPAEFDYQFRSNTELLIANDEWQALISDFTGTYSMILEYIEDIKAAFAGEGWEVISAKTKTYNGNDYLIYDITDGTNRQYAIYTDYTYGDLIVIDLASLNRKTIDEKWLEELSEILSSKKSGNKNIGTFEEIQGTNAHSNLVLEENVE